MVNKDYYSIAEVAEILDVDVRAVKRLIKDGTLPALQLGPRLTRISKYDIPTFQRNKVNDAVPVDEHND